MSKKNKIIVSIVGITIVMLALLGITYAYYLTRIEGNTNTNSISVTTANLKLAYGDGTTKILTKENIIPDNNNPLGTKDFTVSNTGNTKIENYKVVLEYAVIENVVPSVFKHPEDFEITLVCVSKNIETNEVSGTCSGANLKWNNESVEIVKNTIDAEIRHEYELEIYYKDSGIDQSDDMGKNLNLKVQIYGSTDTSTLNGIITGVESGYTMKLHSEPKASVLIPNNNSGEYKYKFIGVEPGEHTLYVLDENGEEVSNETIIINKGTNTNVSGSTITVKDNQSNVYITSTNNGSVLNSTATFNPYSSNVNSLAYHIINNSINNTNGTIYSDKPVSIVAKELSLSSYGKNEITDYPSKNSSITSTNTYTYASDYRIESDGTFSLIEPKTLIYSENYEMLKEKYIVTVSGATEEESASNLNSIYKVSSTDVTETSFNYTIVNKYLSKEKVLSTAQDDYGISYYFRGGVEDNYVNFAGMCWRIVRIQGDGSTKLILEDQDNTCENSNGNWNIPTTTGGTSTVGYYGLNQYNAETLTASDGTTNSSSRRLMDYLNASFNNHLAMSTAFKNFQANFTNEQLLKLKVGDWCMSDEGYIRNGTNGSYTYTKIDNNGAFDLKVKGSTVFYNTYTRLETGNTLGYLPTLECIGHMMDNWNDNSDASTPMYVGAITADEVVYAGGKALASNLSYYLINNYQYNENKIFWTISPTQFLSTRDVVYAIGQDGTLDHAYVNVNISKYDTSFRPMIIINKDINISEGTGTKTTPYVIE